MTLDELYAVGARVGAFLKARGETIAVAESSAGGLISAALLAMPGASAYYLGGAVLYAAPALKSSTRLDFKELRKSGIRSSSEPYAALIAAEIRRSHGADWGLAETGAAGPAGNGYGDPAGHSCLAVAGGSPLVRTLRTGSGDRAGNMLAFAAAALSLIEEALKAPKAA